MGVDMGPPSSGRSNGGTFTSRGTPHVSSALQRGKRLPEDLLADARRRLGSLAFLVAMMCSVFLVVSWIVPIGFPLRLRPYIYPAIIGISLLVLFATRWKVVQGETILFIGQSYQVFCAWATGLLVHCVPWPETLVLGSWSPVALWVLVYPLIVPTRTLSTFVAAGLTAAADPGSIYLLTLAGAIDLPDAALLYRRFMPTFAIIVPAVVTSRIMFNIGVQISEARRVGSYQLLEPIGHGGMGEVWRARHHMLAREAAIKLIRPEHLGDPRSHQAQITIRRFRREVRATASLRSPHTVEVYDFGSTNDGSFFYVMELIDGMDLEAAVRRLGPMRPARVIHLLIQACHSLAEAHSRGLVHRDVKPANILICRQGLDVDVVKLLDFGLVLEWVPGIQGSMETTSQSDSGPRVIGTPGWMAPEMATLSGEIDGRTDLYGLGCVAYWLLSGKLVFNESDPTRLMERHVHEAPRKLGERASQEIPRGLEAIVMSCLSKDPLYRPASAEVLAERLRALAPEVGVWSKADAAPWWNRVEEGTWPYQPPEQVLPKGGRIAKA